MKRQPSGGGEREGSSLNVKTHVPLPRNTILLGDVRECLLELPPASVDCVITSPPYFGVRNYGHDHQLGAGPSVEHWVCEMRVICREVARVLRPTGSLWLNLGDSYSRRPAEGAGVKSLLLGPSRVALALIEDGWVLRNQVIWAKSNPMPSSVADRLTTTHEVVYFLTRSRHYYFDLDAIRQPLGTAKRQSTSRPARTYPPTGTGAANRPGWTLNDNRGLFRLKASGLAGHPRGKNPGDVWTLPTAGFRGGHFAAYPLTLAERSLLASCPERVCSMCGQAWHRELQRQQARLLAVGDLQPACQCGAEAVPGVVLDPFIGTGTTALAAEKHNRDWLGIELNAGYVALAEQRLAAQHAKATPPKAQGREHAEPPAA